MALMASGVSLTRPRRVKTSRSCAVNQMPGGAQARPCCHGVLNAEWHRHMGVHA